MNKLRFICALLVGKLVCLGISLVARERGTNLPGQIALKLDPQFIRHVKGLCVDKVIFVSGTNGKSTTTNLLAHVLRSSGLKVACNLEGANLLAGVAATLLKDVSLGGRMRSEYVLMETDERFLPLIYSQLPARHICLTNVQKDQVQRNGEPDLIVRKLATVMNENTVLYVNNDEPNSLALADLAGRVVRYGVATNSSSFSKDDFYAVTMPCPRCGQPVRFDAYNVDNIGPFSCSDCDFGTAQADFYAEDIDFAGKHFRVGEHIYPFGYATPYFLYCYIAAVAVSSSFGVSPKQCAEAFDSFVNISGRMEDVHFGNKTIHYIRMKQENPETVQSALNVIAADPSPKIFMLGLDELVDFHPHYTNTFYTFDCDFHGVVASNVEKYICFSGSVAYDAALRLMYAGANQEALVVLPTNDDATILAELNKSDCENVYLITWLKKFHQLADYAKRHETKQD